jgi:hypothetical protein
MTMRAMMNTSMDDSADCEAKGDVKKRRCLSCEGAFDSQWAGERICPHCKQSSAWRGGVSYRPARTR